MANLHQTVPAGPALKGNSPASGTISAFPPELPPVSIWGGGGMKLGKMKSQRSCAVLGVPWSLPTGHRTLLRPGARWQDFPPSSFSVCQALDPCRRTALATGLPSLRASTLEAPGSITHSQSAALSKACSRPPAAKCNVSPLTPTPAAQPAVTQPAAFPGRPASGCTLRRQPSFPQWVRLGPFLPRCGVILPSPSPEKGPCAFALSRGAVCAVPCGQALGGSRYKFPHAEHQL